MLELLDEELEVLRSKLKDLPINNTEPNQELYFVTREMTLLQHIRHRVEDEV